MDVLLRARLALAVFFLLVVVPATSVVEAARISDVANTPHNLSMNWGDQGTDPRDVKAVSEQRICVFCHTPHGAQTVPGAPLWNRSFSAETYSMYDSSSMDATQPTSPANSSKLCLSCHDGTIAIGAVNVLNGSSATIAMQGTDSNMMPAGDGNLTGYTRNLGVDLRNDHPISITYDDNLAALDGELYKPTAAAQVGERGSGVKPLLPLVVDHRDGAAKVGCVTCHDPHIRSSNEENIKFLRLNRYQTTAAPGAEFDSSRDIICLGCHKKEGWQDSAHANAEVADEVYTATAAAQRDFPNGIPVWRAACLNCHDTHTVAGSRRLLREGTDDINVPKSGGNSAIEETCYQCHSSDGGTLTNQGVNSSVPDIKTDFNLNRRMPITSIDQAAGEEVHDIGTGTGSQLGKDFIESPLLLGKGNLNNRHAECTDCHNPHRVTKNRLATDDPSMPAVAGTHDHTGIHSNLISGVLRGSWGVEPQYASAEFTQIPISFDVKRGVPLVNGTMNVDDGYVTREYQICLKCHSNYAFDDVSGIAGYNYPGRPALGSYNGGTPYNTNNMTVYTNQAMEFQAPNHHQGSPMSTLDSGAAAALQMTGYRYFRLNFDSFYWEWEFEMIYNTMPVDCQRNQDRDCVCVTCTSGPDATIGANSYKSTHATCGAGDVDTFASTGSPGYSNSPWDGWLWDGVVEPPYPYYAEQCTKTVNFTDNNHRSWHPVMQPTKRTPAVRDLGADTAAFLPPWDAGIGEQTMYCSDCHGSDTAAGTVVPNGGENGDPWGPHGSQNDFILKGEWGSQTGGYQPDDLCFKCHDYDVYGNPEVVSSVKSGFSTDNGGGLCSAGAPTSNNLHTAHADAYRTGFAYGDKFRCSACHVAVPHGWKNKALLVNLNDVGPEAGLPPGTKIKDSELPYNNGPYYLNAVNYIYNFKPSGQWTAADCGNAAGSGPGAMGTACGHLP